MEQHLILMPEFLLTLSTFRNKSTKEEFIIRLATAVS